MSENAKRAKRKTVPYAMDENSALSHQAISKRFGVTFQAIQQTEQKALRKIRRAIEREAKHAGCTPLEWLLGDE